MNNLDFSVKAIRKASTHLTEEPEKAAELRIKTKIMIIKQLQGF